VRVVGERVEAQPFRLVAGAVGPGGRRYALGGLDPEVHVFEAASGERSATCRGLREHCIALAFSPDGGRLAVFSGSVAQGGYGANVLRLYDARDGGLLAGPRSLHGWVRAATWAPDGRALIAGTITGQVVFLSPETGEVQGQLIDVAVGDSGGLLVGRAHAGTLRGVKVGPDGKHLYTVARGSTPDEEAENVIKAWDLETRRVLSSAGTRHAPVSAELSPSGELLAVGMADGWVEVWRVR
jgi:WD40 repeat protein